MRNSGMSYNGVIHGPERVRTWATNKQMYVKSFVFFFAAVYVTVLQTYRLALLPADVGGAEVLNRETLLLHVEAPQPLTWLLPASTLGLQHTPAGKTTWLYSYNRQNLLIKIESLSPSLSLRAHSHLAQLLRTVPKYDCPPPLSPTGLNSHCFSLTGLNTLELPDLWSATCIFKGKI